MIVKTGLLIVSNPKHIGKVLSSIKTHVNNTLYIQLHSALSDPFGQYHANVFTSWPKFSQTLRGIYSQVANICEELDVRILLSGIKYKNLKIIHTQSPVDLIIFDKKHEEEEMHAFIKGKISNIAKGYEVVTVDSGSFDEHEIIVKDETHIYKHTVLGGTFDQLHIAHKLLLTEAALRSSSRITVGVTEDNMLEGKTLHELIEPIETRMQVVEDFLRDINPELEINVVPISDPLGPTKSDPTMDLLVVSDETIRGGNNVNEVRQQNGLNALDVLCVELIDEPHRLENEECKISSSTARMRSLGCLLRTVEPNESIPDKPYVVGLTELLNFDTNEGLPGFTVSYRSKLFQLVSEEGRSMAIETSNSFRINDTRKNPEDLSFVSGGIGSGKSSVAKYLASLGAYTINCDLLGHVLYEPGKPCYNNIVAAFGNEILAETGEINRRALATVVFNDKNQLDKLNSIVWPAIAEEVQRLIGEADKEVVIIEAAVLLAANWQKYCHEVWATMIPKEEAIKRIQKRNNLTRDEAAARISSQISNREYIKEAHVVICTLWTSEYTAQLLDKAWKLLMERMNGSM